jgi:hypothetical protein
MFLKDVVKDGEEAGIFSKGIWRRRNSGCGTDRKRFYWRRFRKKREDVSAIILFMDILEKVR